MISRHLTLSAALLAVALSAPATVLAQGNVRIQQSDGTKRTYGAVTLRLQGDTLSVVSPDRVGTLAVKHAACTYRDGLRRCYPYEFTLSQHGMHHIALRRGTLYLNVSDAWHQLPHSSRAIAPHSVLALLETQRGTLISINGKLDEVKP